MMTIIVQFALILILFLLSAFFAGTETGVYRLSRLRLRIGVQQNKTTAKLLTKLLRDGQGLILSILVGNNLVNYCATSLVTVMLFNYLQDHHKAEIYATAILTPTLFLAGEMLPKILYYHKANTLMPSLAWLVWLFNRLFILTGIVAILKGISKMLAFDTTAVEAAKRHQVRQIIHETQEEGLLTEAQKEMMGRLMDLDSLTVRSVMTRLKSVEMVDVKTDAPALLEHLRQNTNTRQLVCDGSRQNILGFVPIYKVLAENTQFDNLHRFIIKLPEIDRRKTVLEGINFLRNQKSPIALVMAKNKNHNTPLGIVTLTDLIEELTGDLTP